MTTRVQTSLLDLRLSFLGFLERRLHDRALAEDILQSAYVRALEAGGSLRKDESAVAWFYRILRNALIDHYRSKRAEGSALERWALELQREQAVPEPFLLDASCRCITGALTVIAPAYSELLRAIDLGEETLTGYARSCGITPANAAVRAHRARAALRKQLIKCCGICFEHACLECTCQP